MGLLGGGDSAESALSATSGWGVMSSANQSSAEWGAPSPSTSASSSTSGAGPQPSASSSNSATASWSSAVAVSGKSEAPPALSTSPKLSSSWAQAACKGLTSSNSSVVIQSSAPATVMSGSSQSAPTSQAAISQSEQFGRAPSNSGEQSSGVQQQQQSSYSLGATLREVQRHEPSTSSSGNNLSASTSAFAMTNQAGGGEPSTSTASNNAAGQFGQRQGATGQSGFQEVIGQLSEEFRDTLLADKWGSSVINQESPWNLPPSPHTGSAQSSPKDTSTWRCPVNSGTEIWESSVRQKKNSLVPGMPGAGLPSTAPSGLGSMLSSSTAWGPAPATPQIGGTWGEEEEDPSNHWTGVPQPPTLLSGGPPGGPSTQFSHSMGPGGHATLNHSISNWSAGANMANGSSTLGNSSLNGWNNGDHDPRNKSTPNWGGGTFGDSDDANWPPADRNLANDFGTWNPDPPAMKKDSGWEKDGDGMKGGVDDGTAVWGNAVRHGTKPSNWKDGNKYGGNNTNKNGGFNGWNAGGNGGGSGNGGGAGGGGKQPQVLPRTWTDGNAHQRKSPSLWNEDTKSLNGNSPASGWLDSNPSLLWSDAAPGYPHHNNNNNNVPNHHHNANSNHHNNNNSNHHNSNHHSNNNNHYNPHHNLRQLNGPKGLGSGLGMPNDWNSSEGRVDTSDWGTGPSNGPRGKSIGHDNMHNNRPFNRSFDPMGFKKDDMGIRNQMRYDDPLFDLDMQPKLNLGGGYNGSNNMSNNLAQLVKSVMDKPTRNQLGGMNQGPPGGANPNHTHVVQLIQLAISNGFLNPQVLNQPQSSQNLAIISDILQQVKLLRQYSQQQGSGGYGMNHQMRINQIKASIGQLQNRYQMQCMMDSNKNDSMYGGSTPGSSVMDSFSSSSGGASQQGGSRLHSWKRADADKSQGGQAGGGQNDFIRAPGGITKPTVGGPWSSSFMPPDSTDHGWGTTATASDLKHDKSDLIDEYPTTGGLEFGRGADPFDYKPWKAPATSASTTTSGAKGLEDDPRSPLATGNMFSWSPQAGSSASNSNRGAAPDLNNYGTSGYSLWSYNAPPMQSNKKNSGGWGTSSGDYLGSESLWNAPLEASSANANGQSSGGGGNQSGNGSKPPRGPPPGLSKGAANNGGAASGYGGGQTHDANIWNSSNGPAAAEYLRLRNLTPQIDGSTLKTLCLQHGPLNLFHLYHDMAIVRYMSRDQAAKAQAALNNCVLGNTTILAEQMSESEAQQLLHILQSSSNGGGNGSGTSGAPSSTWSSSGSQASHAVSAYQRNGTTQSSLPSPAASTMPYGTAPQTTHSAAAAAAAGSMPYNPMMMSNGFSCTAAAAAGWSAPGSANLWDMQNSGSSLGAGLWSSGGFSATGAGDRNTPQGYLPVKNHV